MEGMRHLRGSEGGRPDAGERLLAYALPAAHRRLAPVACSLRRPDPAVARSLHLSRARCTSPTPHHDLRPPWPSPGPHPLAPRSCTLSCAPCPAPALTPSLPDLRRHQLRRRHVHLARGVALPLLRLDLAEHCKGAVAEARVG